MGQAGRDHTHRYSHLQKEAVFQTTMLPVHVGPHTPVSDEGLGQTGDRADCTGEHEHPGTEPEVSPGVHPLESATSVCLTRFLTESWGSLMD